MQRLHENDLAGHLLQNDGFELLKIPVIAPSNLNYKLGNKEFIFKQNELLNQELDNYSSINRLETEIGTRNFAAQYLQSPLPNNFQLLDIKDITLYSKLPCKVDYYVLSWDTAIKVSTESDYTVCTCWAVVDQYFYLVSMIRQKLTYPMLKKEIQKYENRYKPKYLLIEDKASGQSIIQDLKLEGYKNIKAIRPKIDKVTRFASVTPIFQAGRVLIPEKSSYKNTFVNEITSFPNTKHDDIVDSVSQFLNFIKEVKIPQPKIRLL